MRSIITIIVIMLAATRLNAQGQFFDDTVICDKYYRHCYQMIEEVVSNTPYRLNFHAKPMKAVFGFPINLSEERIDEVFEMIESACRCRFYYLIIGDVINIYRHKPWIK